MNRKIALRDRLHFSVEAIRNRFSDCDVPKDIDGLVISPGGVASTMLLNHISLFISVNDSGNKDGLKHSPVPPKDHSIDVPAVLMTRDRQQIVKSLSRRDYFPHQAIRLASLSFFVVPKAMRRKSFYWALERQYRTWIKNYPNLLVIDYAEIWDRKAEIGNHFGITDPTFISDFPTRHEQSIS